MRKFSKGQFLLSCGGQGPLKILLENRETGSKNTFDLAQPNVLVGQHAAADIRLKHPDVGTRHFLLQLFDGRLFCLQLSNRSPVYWGGKPNSWGWIGPQDQILFGPFKLSILDGLPGSIPGGDPYANPLMSSPNSAPPLFLEHRSAGRPFRGQVNRALSLLGSSPACKFRIQSDRISSIHCSLVRTSDGIWAVDLGGHGGIGVNNVVSRVARLEDGDVFEMGGVEFHIRYETPLREIAPPAAGRMDDQELRPPVEEEKPLVSAIVLAEPSSVALTRDREVFERMIGPVLDHFAACQNQTFLQFQDLLNNMMQAMGSMFRDQLDSVRDEMRRFDQLSVELANLQKMLSSIPEAIPEPIPDAIEIMDESESPPKPVVPQPEPRRLQTPICPIPTYTSGSNPELQS